MSKENEIELMSFTEDGQRWLQCKSCYEYKKVEENIKASAWLNLFVGLYNMYLYSQGEWWFNFLIGSLCIGAWVFFRKV